MKSLATALMLSMSVLAAGAQAAEADQGPTRAQVQAELQQAKADGQYTFGELAYPPKPVATTAGKSRDQVRDELAQAEASGNYTFGELDYPPKAR